MSPYTDASFGLAFKWTLIYTIRNWIIYWNFTLESWVIAGPIIYFPYLFWETCLRQNQAIWRASKARPNITYNVVMHTSHNRRVTRTVVVSKLFFVSYLDVIAFDSRDIHFCQANCKWKKCVLAFQYRNLLLLYFSSAIFAVLPTLVQLVIFIPFFFIFSVIIRIFRSNFLFGATGIFRFHVSSSAY